MNKSDIIEIPVGGVGCEMRGFYKIQVVDSKTGLVVRDYGWNKNLILNGGMDAVASVGICNLNAVAIAGTGSRPNSITSSNSTITQSGNIITLWPEIGGLQDFSSSVMSGSERQYTHSLETGDVIIYANNSQSNVLGIDTVGGFTASVDTSYTIESGSNQTFTIWKTSQVGMHKEIKRSSTYLPGSSSVLGFNCGTVISHSAKTMRRTYDFTAETTQKNYSEVGVSWTGTARAGVFSRVLLPETVSIAATYQLRMIHDLMVTVSPAYPRYVEPTITGWTNTKGTESLQNFLLYDVATTGQSNDGTTGLDFGVLDPASNHGYDYYYANSFFSDVGTAPAAFGSYVSRTLNGSTITGKSDYNAGGLTTYVTGTYTRYKTANFRLTDGVDSTIWSTGFGAAYGVSEVAHSTEQGIVLVFDEPHEKLNTQIASITYKFTWARVIQNGL